MNFLRGESMIRCPLRTAGEYKQTLGLRSARSKRAALVTAAEVGGDSNNCLRRDLERFGQPAEQVMRLLERAQAVVRLVGTVSG